MKGRLLTMCAATVAMAIGLSGCGSPTSRPSQQVNTDKGLLVVSFGTSFDDNRELSIGGIERALKKAYPGYDVRRAFTAQTIINILAKRNIDVDNVDEAMEKFIADGVKDIVVQPTTVMDGLEYADTIALIHKYSDKFNSVAVGRPLLSSDDDFTAVAEAMVDVTKEYDVDGTAIVYMGHGTEAASNGVYAKMQQVLTAGGHKRYCVGTVEASPSVDDVMECVKASGATHVVMRPLMIVAGDHANNDMAGDDPESWKSIFSAAGFTVTTIIEGLGQVPAIQDIYVNHARAAVALVNEGKSVIPAMVISVKDMANGTYPVTVETDSSMFKVAQAELTVADGKGTVRVSMSADGFNKLYLGSADEASQATTHIAGEILDGHSVFSFPVTQLDVPISVAAMSVKKNSWFDHKMTVLSQGLPMSALAQ